VSLYRDRSNFNDDVVFLYNVIICVCKKMHETDFNRFIVSCLRTILYVTHQFMHDYIVKSSIASKVAQKATDIDTSTSENTKACTIMSTETTNNTL